MSDQGGIVFITTDRKTAATLSLQDIVELSETEQYIAQRMLGTCLIRPQIVTIGHGSVTCILGLETWLITSMPYSFKSMLL